MRKKAIELFEVNDNKVLIPEENIEKLTDSDKSKIAFYSKTLGYEVVFIKPEPQKRKSFTIDKATAYINAYDKKGLNAFTALKKDADKVTEKYKVLVQAKKQADSKDATKEEKAAAPKENEIADARKAMIIAQKDAYIAQKNYFIDKYGEDAYKAVKEM